jgi:hypothetical protein
MSISITPVRSRGGSLVRFKIAIATFEMFITLLAFTLKVLDVPIHCLAWVHTVSKDTPVSTLLLHIAIHRGI